MPLFQAFAQYNTDEVSKTETTENNVSFSSYSYIASSAGSAFLSPVLLSMAAEKEQESVSLEDGTSLNLAATSDTKNIASNSENVATLNVSTEQIAAAGAAQQASFEKKGFDILAIQATTNKESQQKIENFTRELQGLLPKGDSGVTISAETLLDTRDSRSVLRGAPEPIPEETEVQGDPPEMSLSDFEKPRIISIIQEGYRDNGVPRKVVLIVKKLRTNKKWLPISYKVFKKSVFLDREYSRIAELSPSQPVPQRYKQVIEDAGLKSADVFLYIDENIDPGNVYAYKIRVDYESIVSIATKAALSNTSTTDLIQGQQILRQERNSQILR